MINLIAFLTIMVSFFFVFKMVEKRFSKDKIFYTLYASGLAFVFIFIASLINSLVFILIIFFTLIIILYLIYTDFFIFYTIRELLLKNQKVKQEKSQIKEVFNEWVSNKLKEINNVKKQIQKIYSPHDNILDFVLLFSGFTVSFFLLLFIV